MTAQPSQNDRLLASSRALTDSESSGYLPGVYEYTVVDISPLGLDGTPTDPTLPPIQRAQLAATVGPTTMLTLVGSNVLVVFVNADPKRPFVLGFAITQTMLLDATTLGGSVPGPVTVVTPIFSPLVTEVPA